MTAKLSVASVSFRHTFWMLFLATCLCAATPSITLQVSNETAPPAGYAQFKISLTAPALVSNGSVSMTFDPAIFGNISNVTAFTATGDQAGFAHVNGQQVTASFSSASASFGQLPGLPVFVVTIPVLPTAKPGATSAVTVDPTQSPWQDPQGNTYAVTVNPGTITVGGTLSIQSVIPGGGLLPSGTVVSIHGTGFDAASIVTIDGVSLVSTQFVSSAKINVTLGGATEFTGKHVHVQTGGGAQTDFFCSLSSAPTNAASTVFPLLPFTTFTNVTWDRPDDSDYQESIALQNQNLFPVTVTLFSLSDSQTIAVSPSITIPPGELYLLPTTVGINFLEMVSSAPMRMLEYRVNLGFFGPSQSYVFPPTPAQALPQPSAQPSAAAWTWQIGTAAPAPVTVGITGSFPFTATVSSAPWLSISAAQGTEPATLTITPNVSSLGVGTYSGTVTIHTILPPSLSAVSVADVVVPISIQVSASPFIKAFGTGYFTATATTGIINVSSSGSPAQFSVSVDTSWLSATPATGTTPGSINVSVNPSGLAAGTYMGNVIVQGPANSVTLPVEFVISPVSTGPAPLSLNPSSFSFALAAGTKTQYQFDGSANFTLASASAQSVGNWLTVTTVLGLYFQLDARALSPGTYLGTITLNSTTGLSLQVPITLVVVAPSAPLTVTPASVSLTVQAGQSISQSFTVTSTPNTLISKVTTFPATGFSGDSPATPATVTVSFSPTQPGTHYGSVTFTSGSGSVTVPIVLNVTASAAFPPILASVVSSASGLPAAISPDEIISLFGTGLGSQVLIDNIAAPVIYASSSQVNAIVPFEIVGGTATVKVLGTGTWEIPVAAASPSIFTGGVVNQDGSINSASNPAPRGTAIQIYATGGGQTSPLSSTGGVAQAAANLVLPVTVSIGGAKAQVLYAGAAPGEVNGVVQINVIVPLGATTGTVPVVITIGGVASPPVMLSIS